MKLSTWAYMQWYDTFHGYSSLHDAAAKGDISYLKRLLEDPGLDVTQKKYNRPPVELAFLDTHYDCAILLLEYDEHHNRDKSYLFDTFCSVIEWHNPYLAVLLLFNGVDYQQAAFHQEGRLKGEPKVQLGQDLASFLDKKAKQAQIFQHNKIEGMQLYQQQQHKEAIDKFLRCITILNDTIEYTRTCEFRNKEEKPYRQDLLNHYYRKLISAYEALIDCYARLEKLSDKQEATYWGVLQEFYARTLTASSIGLAYMHGVNIAEHCLKLAKKTKIEESIKYYAYAAQIYAELATKVDNFDGKHRCYAKAIELYRHLYSSDKSQHEKIITLYNDVIALCKTHQKTRQVSEYEILLKSFQSDLPAAKLLSTHGFLTPTTAKEKIPLLQDDQLASSLSEPLYFPSKN